MANGYCIAGFDAIEKLVGLGAVFKTDTSLYELYRKWHGFSIN
jgi:hypothetical protein